LNHAVDHSSDCEENAAVALDAPAADCASPAQDPAWIDVDWTMKLLDAVHVERSPLSNPSTKRDAAIDGVE
jgi:hypothetical protein